jgi:predicted O-linked N-acetylglucosamine transferase (SPINDLY family)
MSAMDYRFTDGWADPVGYTESLHTEALYRLPHGFLCYQPPPDADTPKVGPLPMRKNGYITFASFNNRPKMTERVVTTWATILRAVPGSRLLLKSGAYADPPSRQRTEERFAALGIPGERLTLLGHVASPMEHLCHYQQADLALDTFPYNGTTTTCEALWMGVPVISLAGQTHVGRVGVSLLSRVGLEGLLAQTTNDYVELAVSMAADRDGLAFLRAGLRQRLRDSSLLDPTAVVPSIEEAYRQMWRDLCAGQGPSRP